MVANSDNTGGAETTPSAAPSPSAAQRQARLFISYRHGDPDEEELVRLLKERLTENSRDVFTDQSIPIGADWVSEITRRIEWCDYLVVLLSESSIMSEMVQAEVRLAARRRRELGTPQLLPVRVRLSGPLEYELESYLGRIEYAIWNSPAETSRVLVEILRATEGSGLPNASVPTSTPRPVPDPRRPPPSVDPRTLVAPGGTLDKDDPLYVTRAVDGVVEALPVEQGNTLVIKAARQMGKSSLLLRFLGARQSAKRISFVDFSVFSQDEMATYPVFLTNFATALLRSVAIEPSAARQIQTQQQMTWLFEDVLLPAAKGQLVLAFDEVDRVLGRPFQSDFFTMLRLWHNNRKHPNYRDTYKDFDLGLVISTEPYLLIAEGERSPFNVGTFVELTPFTPEMVRALSDAYQVPLRGTQIEELDELLGGHPYLVRLALYWIAGPRQLSFDELMRHAADPHGPFGEHLRALLFRIHNRPELMHAWQQIVFRGSAPDRDIFYRLYGAGLVRELNGRVVPASLLYARFFKAVL